jgi:hypothetical protein
VPFHQDTDIIEEVVRSRDPSFRSVPSGQLDAALAGLRRESDRDDAARFLLASMRLAALADNAHTRVSPNAGLAVLPLRFVALGRLIYLTEGSEPYLDCRLESVNGVPTDTLMAQAAPWLAGPAARQRAIGAMLLAWPEALDALGAASAEGQITYALSGAEGGTVRLEIGEVERVPAPDLYPARESGTLRPATETTDWASCSALGNTAWHLRLPDFYCNDGDALDRALNAAADMALSDARRAPVFDLRGNRGGNFLKAVPFLDRMARGGRCAILVDKFTFSAAIVFVALVRDRFKGALIVGEAMGDRSEFWAEGCLIPLPQSGGDFRYSTAWHDWNHGRAAPSTPPEIAKHLVAAGSLSPDIDVDITAVDIRRGRDPLLAAALTAIAEAG